VLQVDDGVGLADLVENLAVGAGVAEQRGAELGKDVRVDGTGATNRSDGVCFVAVEDREETGEATLADLFVDDVCAVNADLRACGRGVVDLHCQSRPVDVDAGGGLDSGQRAQDGLFFLARRCVGGRLLRVAAAGRQKNDEQQQTKCPNSHGSEH
jgi:hypothetical protein